MAGARAQPQRGQGRATSLVVVAVVQGVEGDAARAAEVAKALSGVDVAWHLLHSMGDASDFAEAELDMARTFGADARKVGVARIVYLGGLHPEGEELSEHLASRVAVGEALMASGVPTAALQAGLVIGDGSSSFQMLRHLSERLPRAVAPRWVRNTIQPVAVADAVHTSWRRPICRSTSTAPSTSGHPRPSSTPA